MNVAFDEQNIRLPKAEERLFEKNKDELVSFCRLLSVESLKKRETLLRIAPIRVCAL